MNRSLFIIIGFFLFFPAWIFKSGLELIEIFIFLIPFLILPLILHIYIFKKFQNNLNSKLFYFYISLVFTISLDQNYGIMSSVDIIPNFLNIKPYPLYIYLTSAAIIIFVLIVIFLVLFFLKLNGLKIILAFTFVSVIINTFDNRNYLYFEKNFYKENNLKTDFKNNKNKTLIILLDEMSGIESYESNHSSGLTAKNRIQSFFNNWNFITYPNAFSLHQSSATSIPLLLNFEYDESKMNEYRKSYVHEKRGSLINVNNNYFLNDNELKKNKFFDTFKGESITVFQSMSINYCNNKKVINCLQYNPFKTDYDYLSGVKNKRLSRIISLWKLQGSIISNFVWRLLRIKLIDNTLEPYGEKMTIDSLIVDINKHILFSEADLVFVHTLFSHNPYGFDEKCNYDGSRSMNQYKHNIEWITYQNNLERICVIDKLEELFKLLQKNNFWDKINVVVLSDHGSRISKENFEKSYLSSIFAVKSDSFKIDNRKLSTQFLFSKYLNNNHIE